MLYQQQSVEEVFQTQECPNCRKSTMVFDAVNPALFLGGSFAQYHCRRCGEDMECGFLPLMN